MVAEAKPEVSIQPISSQLMIEIGNGHDLEEQWLTFTVGQHPGFEPPNIKDIREKVQNKIADSVKHLWYALPGEGSESADGNHAYKSGLLTTLNTEVSLGEKLPTISSPIHFSYILRYSRTPSGVNSNIIPPEYCLTVHDSKNTLNLFVDFPWRKVIGDSSNTLFWIDSSVNHYKKPPTSVGYGRQWDNLKQAAALLSVVEKARGPIILP